MIMKTTKELLPDLGQRIETPQGSGKVVGLNILERLLQVEIPKQERVIEYTLDEILKEDAGSDNPQNNEVESVDKKEIFD